MNPSILTNRTSPATSAPSAAPARPAATAGESGAVGGVGGIRVVATLFERAGMVSAVVAELPDRPGNLQLKDKRRFSLAEAGSLRGYLKEANVDVVIRIAPTAQTLARATTLPDATTDRNGLADALALVAESELPGHLPWYRRTGGIIRSVGGGGGDAAASPWAILLGWHRPVEAASDSFAAALEGYRQIWTTEAVGLSRLLRSGMGTSGAGPSKPSPAWVSSHDSAAGTVVVAALVEGRLALRVLRAAGGDPSQWAKSVRSAIQETLAPIGGEGHAPDVGPIDPERGLTLSPGWSPVVAGEPRDPDWLEQYGVPSAILETFADPDPAVRLLFNLHAIEPRRRVGIVRGLVSWFASPARAAAAVLVCVSMLLLVPLGVAYARHAALQKHIEGVKGLDDRLAGAEKQVAFSSLLREKRWPMTKLMADIASSTPQGITLEVLEIAQGEPITLRGTAESSELVTTFRENLGKTRVFDSVTAPSTGSSDEGVQFQLQARVSQVGAVHRGDAVDDFAKKPLGKRLYGDSWTPGGDVASTAAARKQGHSKRDHSLAPAPGKGAPPSAAGTASSGGKSTGAAAPIVPAELTDDQIAKLDRTGAMKEFAARKKAASQPGIDAATKQRLLDESEKARQRMTEAGKAAS